MDFSIHLKCNRIVVSVPEAVTISLSLGVTTLRAEMNGVVGLVFSLSLIDLEMVT